MAFWLTSSVPEDFVWKAHFHLCRQQAGHARAGARCCESSGLETESCLELSYCAVLGTISCPHEHLRSRTPWRCLSRSSQLALPRGHTQLSHSLWDSGPPKPTPRLLFYLCWAITVTMEQHLGGRMPHPLGFSAPESSCHLTRQMEALATKVMGTPVGSLYFWSYRVRFFSQCNFLNY